MKFLLSLILYITSFSLSAETIYLTAELDFEPKKIIGIIFNDTNTQYIHETHAQPLENGQLQISFEIDPSNVNNQYFASAILLSEAGEPSFTAVRQLGSKTIQDMTHLLTCREITTADYSSQIKILEELVQIRKQRSKIYIDKIKQILTPELTNNLTLLEESLGIRNAQAISTELDPVELTQRLFRILNAIK